jgi:hypothetical protein
MESFELHKFWDLLLRVTNVWQKKGFFFFFFFFCGLMSPISNIRKICRQMEYSWEKNTLGISL